jgi:Flp pilus assembly protein CpaB
MRRSPRFLLAWCAAMAVAAATGYVVFSDLATLQRRTRDLGPPRAVLVAARPLLLGARVEPDDLRTASVHESAVPTGALGEPEEAIGRVVAMPVPAGAYVHGAHLAPADRDALDALVPAGHRAVRVTPADGMRPPRGAVVDVLAAVDPAPGAPAPAASPVATAARVLEVDDGADGDREYATAGEHGVTLLVTEGEARRLAFAAAYGVLTLALAPPEAACCPSPES